MGFAILFLLVPVICPMLYFCVVSSGRQSPGRRKGDCPLASETGKWVLIAVVLAGVVAAVGLGVPNPYLALTGTAGVVLGAGSLMWLMQSALERGSDAT
jgi:hypothetical protein